MDRHHAAADERVAGSAPTGERPPACGDRPPAPTPTAMPAAVADTMRRVHAALRAGQPPSYEALLAYGLPEPSPPG